MAQRTVRITADGEEFTFTLDGETISLNGATVGRIAQDAGDHLWYLETARGGEQGWGTRQGALKSIALGIQMRRRYGHPQLSLVR